MFFFQDVHQQKSLDFHTHTDKTILIENMGLNFSATEMNLMGFLFHSFLTNIRFIMT